jgi:hypothetical protein
MDLMINIITRPLLSDRLGHPNTSHLPPNILHHWLPPTSEDSPTTRQSLVVAAWVHSIQILSRRMPADKLACQHKGESSPPTDAAPPHFFAWGRFPQAFPEHLFSLLIIRLIRPHASDPCQTIIYLLQARPTDRVLAFSMDMSFVVWGPEDTMPARW